MSHLRHIGRLYAGLLKATLAGFTAPRVLALLSVTAVVAVTNAAICMWLEGWGFVDSLYFSVVSMATVGYGDLSPTSSLSKLVNIGYLVIGIGVFAVTVAELAKTIFDELHRQAEKDAGKAR